MRLGVGWPVDTPIATTAIRLAGLALLPISLLLFPYGDWFVIWAVSALAGCLLSRREPGPEHSAEAGRLLLIFSVLIFVAGAFVPHLPFFIDRTLSEETVAYLSDWLFSNTLLPSRFVANGRQIAEHHGAAFALMYAVAARFQTFIVYVLILLFPYPLWICVENVRIGDRVDKKILIIGLVLILTGNLFYIFSYLLRIDSTKHHNFTLLSSLSSMSSFRYVVSGLLLTFSTVIFFWMYSLVVLERTPLWRRDSTRGAVPRHPLDRG